MKHSPGFLNLVEDAKKEVKELSIDAVKSLLDRQAEFVLLDCREESEWQQGRLPKAVHLSKGVIERDIEQQVPNHQQHIVIYCGGGYRSILAAQNLQKMGYNNVYSMEGGYRAWNEKKLPLAP